VAKAQLMDAAWPGTAVEESNLSVQIAAVRKLLGASPDGGEWIATIPRVGYRFANPAAVSAQAANEATPIDAPSAERGHRPSILVLPFENMSGEPAQEYLADGITEDIIVALMRFRWFFVIARNSSFAVRSSIPDPSAIAHDLGVRYVLRGSLRKAAKRVRISVQLIDAATGTHIWAERYDLELTEIFAIQDEIAERVAGALEPELLKSESVLAAARHTGNINAWDLVRRGTWHFHRVVRDDHLEARKLFRQACALDPELPEAHLWLGRVSAGLVAYGWSENAPDTLAEGVAAATKAIRLDEKNPYAHYALAIVSAYGDALGRAVVAAERSVELAPGFALGHLVLGTARLFSGRAEDAVPPLERGLTLNPYDPQNFVWYDLLALARLFSGQADLALQSAFKALQIRPLWRPILETICCCQVALGRLEEARQIIGEMRALEKPAGDVLAPLMARNPLWRKQLSASLQAAGWP
jgi:TolB-like protein